MKSRSLWRKRKDVMELNDKETESKARQEAALQALFEENKRLGLYDYEIGYLEGKASRKWVGLTAREELDAEAVQIHGIEAVIKWVEAKLKEKNI